MSACPFQSVAVTTAVPEKHGVALARAIDEATRDAQAPCTFEAILKADGLIEAAGLLYESKEASEMAAAFGGGIRISVIRFPREPYKLWVTAIGARPFPAFRIALDRVSAFSRLLHRRRDAS